MGSQGRSMGIGMNRHDIFFSNGTCARPKEWADSLNDEGAAVDGTMRHVEENASERKMPCVCALFRGHTPTPPFADGMVSGEIPEQPIEVVGRGWLVTPTWCGYRSARNFSRRVGLWRRC